MSPHTDVSTAEMPVPSVDGSISARLLPTVLSLIAGSVDVIGFMGLGGLFVSQVTGNLVILAFHLVTGREASLAHILSVPVFIAMLGLTRLLVGGLERIHVVTLRPLLLLQFLLLAGFFGICVAAGAPIDPNAANAILAGMLGVSAMAVQNALVQLSLKGAPSTAVMTTNITRFVMDVGEMLFADSPERRVMARDRANGTWPAIIGFAVGCGLGAGAECTAGLWSLTLPAGLALLALLMGVAIERGEERQ